MTPKKIKNFNQLKTPKGSQDILPVIAYRQEEQRNLLLSLFAGRGYNQIITPTLEKYDSMSAVYTGAKQEELYKLADRSGHILVLRPDVTIPIARVVASRYSDEALPVRVGYFTNIFRWDHHSHTHKEVYQAGIELIGSEGVMADMEVLSILCDSISKLGIDETTGYKLTLVINDTNITDSILGKYSSDAREAFCSNDYSYLKENYPGLCQNARLIGSPDTVFPEAGKLAGAEKIAYLENIHSLLIARYPHIDMVVDITMRPDGNYYSGIVFDLILDNTVVAAGGRYDKLFQTYGTDKAAIGFAIYIDSLNRALSSKDNAARHLEPNLMTIFYTTDSLETAYEEMIKSWENGHVVNTVLLDNPDEIDNYSTYNGLFILCSGGQVALIRENVAL